MSTDPHNTGHGAGQEPTHDDVAFEPRDVKVSSVMKFLIYMGISIVAVYFICIGIYRTMTEERAASDVPPPAVRMGQPARMPPEPRLQGVPGHETDAQQDLRDKLAADNQDLAEAHWVDEKAGIAQIPVEDAMTIIAEKGLPGVAPAPAAKKKK
ncbi:MAG: hypothetical protein LAN84_08120 [Acidobacteriia bacterium]|nr:hypothetical protein [Terriglobia bacterium]